MEISRHLKTLLYFLTKHGIEEEDLLVAIAITLKDKEEAMEELMIYLEDENPTREQIILKFVELAKGKTTNSNLIAIGKKDKRTREMVDEAVYRMKMLGMDKDIINDFEVNNNIQIYEPPFGCGYHLDEEEDSELIKEIERQ